MHGSACYFESKIFLEIFKSLFSPDRKSTNQNHFPTLAHFFQFYTTQIVTSIVWPGRVKIGKTPLKSSNRYKTHASYLRRDPQPYLHSSQYIREQGILSPGFPFHRDELRKAFRHRMIWSVLISPFLPSHRSAFSS